MALMGGEREWGGFAENGDFLVLAVDDLFSSKRYSIAIILRASDPGSRFD